MSRKYFVLQAAVAAAKCPRCNFWTNNLGGWRQMKRIVTCVAALCFLVVCSTTIWAQGTAQISGTAKDQSGAVLPGVEITATQTDTGITRTTVSNETGSYVLP